LPQPPYVAQSSLWHACSHGNALPCPNQLKQSLEALSLMVVWIDIG
jgi:hypothetical protein